MSFDVAQASYAEATGFLPMTDPVTGVPFRDENGVDVGVTLRSRYCMAAQEEDRRQAERSIELNAKRARDQLPAPSASETIALIEQDSTEILAACTIAWSFDKLDGQPFPCNTANARKFWADPRFRNYRGQAQAFLRSEANFTKR